jgi:hypothetical protein
MAVAERAAAAYAGNGKLAAVAVAGSVGAGLADRFSDLELDCYWSSPPGDGDRTGPISALGGELTDWWDYDEADREWAEDYLLGGLGVTVSNFTTGTIELATALVQQALTEEVLTGWQARDALAARGDDLAARELEDTVLLAEQRTGTDLSAFRQALGKRRQALDPPPPDR